MTTQDDGSPSTDPSIASLTISSPTVPPTTTKSMTDHVQGQQTPSTSPQGASVRPPLYNNISSAASRTSSPIGAARVLGTSNASVFAGTPTQGAQLPAMPSRSDDLRNLIQQALVPHIAIHTSADTDDLTQEKGFKHGLWQLLRPYGERIQGKVTIRDSAGSNRSCDDYAVRFVRLGDVAANSDSTEKAPIQPVFLQRGGNLKHIEQLIDKHLCQAEGRPEDHTEDYLNFKDNNTSTDHLSPHFALYMRRLLSGLPLQPHETFAHPVACVIAISSRNPNPIDTLRRLYDDSSRGEQKLPIWVNQEFLRYYVLVHDEEKDDISKSTILFEQMKRHFGLHCHLLRLRSSHCIITDDDAISFPTYSWMTASEELVTIETREHDEEVGDSQLCIYDSDSTAIRTFIREMVTQSVIPSMERCVSTWNDQVASRRRGIGARISKLWTGFGGSTTTATTNNYDATHGYYNPSIPEALMRKLADFAFMLRDWKLAQSTYDFCRSDYNNDKAWKYHAAANEMAAVSALISSQVLSSRTRSDTIDPMIETATYSYLTRCNAAYGATRCLILVLELLKLRGDSATDDAARWGARFLELQLAGPIPNSLVMERIAACHASRKGTGSGAWGARTRKAALWSILAAHEWIGVRKFGQAEACMHNVKRLYKAMPYGDSLANFGHAKTFTDDIVRGLREARGEGEERRDMVEEESEALDDTTRKRAVSSVGTAAVPAAEKGEQDDSFV